MSTTFTCSHDELIKKLEDISGLSKEEAKKLLFETIEHNEIKKLNELVKIKKAETNKNIKKLTSEIIATAIERYASDYISMNTVASVTLNDSKIKGKIIGKEGRNIKAFESYTGVDIIIDKENNKIKLSSFDPTRRAIAQIALKNLIDDGRIQPQKIKEFVDSAQKELKIIILEKGKEAAEELEIFDIHEEILKKLGVLAYRTSYGQDVLKHSIEVAKIAGAMACELKLDSKIAMRAGLLHDIGKAVDYKNGDVGSSHVKAGVALAEKYGENHIIINAIHSHHGDIATDNIYSVLVSAADTISAARVGARDNVQKDYIQRMDKIEEICEKISGIKKSYAVQSGRVIRIFVDPKKVGDHEMNKIIDEVAREIKKNVIIPGEITIQAIREIEVEKII